ncbi:MAG: helix-turn-helix domain-containing protein [Actinomycetota bacterium]
MSAMDAEHVWHVPGLTLTEKAVLCFVTCKANRREGNVMWWSQAQIAEQVGCSRATVKRVLRSLEHRGLISREARHFEADGGGVHRGADFITVHVQRMLEAIAAGSEDEPDTEGGGVTQPGGGCTVTPPPVRTDPRVGSHRSQGWGHSAPAEPGNLTQEGTQEENPGSEPASASPGDVRASSDEQKKSTPADEHDDPEPMILEDERKRQMDALAALMGGRAA